MISSRLGNAPPDGGRMAAPSWPPAARGRDQGGVFTMENGRPTLDAIHFAVGSAIFGALTPEHVDIIAKYGFPGFEPYRSSVMAYLDRPQELKDVLDRRGITLITCSNGG